MAAPSLDVTEIPVVCPACGASLVPASRHWRCSGCDRSFDASDGIVRLLSGSQGAPGFDPHFFDALPSIEEEHFWFVARRELIIQELRRSVPDLQRRALFDIGCGTGSLVAFLARSGVRVAGVCDAYIEGLRLAQSRVQAPLVLVDEGRLPPIKGGQSMIGIFDVLEHIDDDAGTLRFLASVLEPGGILAMTVPAHPFLFGQVDELSCHRRRYRRADLERKLVDAGFEIRALTHFMAPIVPILLVVRGVETLLRHHTRANERLRTTEHRVLPGLNESLRFVLGLERLLIRRVSMPFGSSLLAVAARRP